MATQTSPSVETVTTGADKAKLAAAGLLVVGAVVAFYMLGQQDLWLRVVALLGAAGRRRGDVLHVEPGKQLIAFGQDRSREVRRSSGRRARKRCR